jgi:nucleolin
MIVVFQKVTNSPFRRVTLTKQDVAKSNPNLADNSYHSKSGDPWGMKAAQDLGKVQGKSFRHEKTKKKRGSYAGGQIDMGVHSYKFEVDSD